MKVQSVLKFFHIQLKQWRDFKKIKLYNNIQKNFLYVLLS